jgi:hypothetical protein
VLGTIALLDTTVGPCPAQRTWRDEFVQLNLGPLDRFCCKFAWALELRELRWPYEHADALPVLYTWANDRICETVQARDAAFAASVWAVGEALVAAAVRQRVHLGGVLAHPLVYANLSGRGGLLQTDAAWEVLTKPPPADGQLVLRTRAVVLASDGGSNAAIVWAGQPHAKAGAAGVVCFRPCAADASGLHALIDVGSGRFALPPLSEVRLESVTPAGEWRAPWLSAAEQPPTSCALLTVRVTWA